MRLSLKESRMKLLNATNLTGNPGYVGRRRWGNPDFLLEALTRATCAAFIKESRMKFREASKVDRKPGGSPNDRF
jgi:hypothetical protein